MKQECLQVESIKNKQIFKFLICSVNKIKIIELIKNYIALDVAEIYNRGFEFKKIIHYNITYYSTM